MRSKSLTSQSSAKKKNMKELIAAMPQQLAEAQRIFEATELTPPDQQFDNVVVLGLGGSGIGGTILADILQMHSEKPILSVKNYELPAYVGSNSLVIASSYSGNTEETLMAVEEAHRRGAHIAAVTSGGRLREMANENGWNCIVVPGGNPPRSMFAYSFVQLLNYVEFYGIVNIGVVEQLSAAANLLEVENDTIRNEAEDLAKYLYNRIPAIYVADGYTGLAWRFRQQLNENSKMLAWHAVIPEMNHNELVGWAGGNKTIAPVFLRNKNDFDRNQTRIGINEEIVQKHTTVREVWSKGETRLQNTIYLIHLTDWTSFYLSELNGVDIEEIKVIEYLKSELAKS
jgi:glucose/mannose-6-phosphate isomerase